MKTVFVISVVALYVVGTLGVPVVAFSCKATGKAGVTVRYSEPLPPCLVDSCCETKQPGAAVEPDEAVSCCDVSGHSTVRDTQVPTSASKRDATAPADIHPLLFDPSPAGSAAAHRTHPDVVPRPTINMPLRI